MLIAVLLDMKVRWDALQWQGAPGCAGSPIGDVVLQEGVLLGSIDKFFIAEGATRYTIYPGYLPIYLAWVESR